MVMDVGHNRMRINPVGAGFEIVEQAEDEGIRMVAYIAGDAEPNGIYFRFKTV